MAQRLTLNGFRLGIDKRRTQLSSPVGSLYSLNNAHINNGQEIEKRKALFPMIDQWFMMDGATYGLNAESQGFVVHGSATTPTLAGNNGSIADQFSVTILYNQTGYTVTHTAGNTTVSFVHSSGAIIGVANNSTTALGTMTITNNNTANPSVQITGTWAAGDIFSVTLTVGITPTTCGFTIQAMPADAVTTAGVATQLAEIIRKIWPPSTTISITVAGSVITLADTTPNNWVGASTLTESSAGTLTFGGSGTATMTITVGGTWLINDYLWVSVQNAADVKYAMGAVRNTTRGFTAYNLSAGSGKTPPITYQRLRPPTNLSGGTPLSNPTLSSIVESCSFGDKTFSIALFSDGYYYEYYDGISVGDSFAGFYYSYMSADVHFTRQFMRAYGTFPNDQSITVLAQAVTIAGVGFAGLTFRLYNGATFGAGCVASVTSIKGKVIIGTTGGSSLDVGFSGTTTWTTGDKVTITLTDSLANQYVFGYGKLTAKAPVYCLPFKNKVYVLTNDDGGTAIFSAVANATAFNNRNITGTGYIILAQYSKLNDVLVSAAPYQGSLAFFFRNSTQIWNLFDNAATNALVQILDETGCVSQRGVIPVGQLDVIFLSDSGFRSLRVRDSSNNAFVVDTGSPIDRDITDVLRQFNVASSSTNVFYAISGREPIENRLIFLLYYVAGGTTYNLIGVWVLSYYPEVRTTAWSTYSWQTFLQGDGSASAMTGEKFITWKGALYCRGSVLGLDGLIVYDTSLIGRTAYNVSTDASQVTGETPWFDAKHMELTKDSEAVDAVLEGWWQLELGTDPQGTTKTQVVVPYAVNQPTPDVQNDSTFGQGVFSIRLRGSHVKLKFSTKSGYTGAARLGAYTGLFQTEDQQ